MAVTNPQRSSVRPATSADSLSGQESAHPTQELSGVRSWRAGAWADRVSCLAARERGPGSSQLAGEPLEVGEEAKRWRSTSSPRPAQRRDHPAALARFGAPRDAAAPGGPDAPAEAAIDVRI